MTADFFTYKETAQWMLALIPLLPLAGFLINGIGWLIARDKWPRPVVNAVAVGTVAASFALSVNFFLYLHSHSQGAEAEFLSYKLFDWIQVGNLSAPFSLVFDRLSAVMCLIVTGVGGLIHLYSTGYMADDKAFARYFSYLNLFTFAMLLLVMGKNIVLMFVGWEGVGLCSYLLIGFWYEDNEKAGAGLKAFIVNRIGDFGFLTAILTIFWLTSRLGRPTLDFYTLAQVLQANSEAVAQMTIIGVPVAFFIGLALFMGATGKSAQVPLYVWLPDAMAGPAPASALINAATMVTAGVYMIGRLNVIYFFSPVALMIVAGVGVATAIFSATIGFTQNDIKKVLAYATMSQLGLMFTAMGVGAYGAGIFLLTTHASFMALLLLGSGSVIHGLAGEQDLRKMGGLSKYMPITCWAMFAGYLAISGFPLLSGSVSKDAILWRAFSNGLHPAGFNHVVYIVGLLAAAGTAISMTRLMMLTFFTPQRLSPEAERHVRESPWTMTVPLIVLAGLSVLGGALNWPKLLGGGAGLEHWLDPMWAVKAGETGEHAESAAGLEFGLMAFAAVIALAALMATYVLYARYRDKTRDLAEGLGPIYQASLDKYWVDEIYRAAVIEPTKVVSYFLLFKIVDTAIVDGLINAVGRATKWASEHLKFLQTGVMSDYALWMVFGLLAILAYFFGLR
jgi:NADH-quinone oxidoreductase subunit L